MHERTSDVKKEQKPIGDITDITLVVAGGEGSVCVCVTKLTERKCSLAAHSVEQHGTHLRPHQSSFRCAASFTGLILVNYRTKALLVCPIRFSIELSERLHPINRAGCYCSTFDFLRRTSNGRIFPSPLRGISRKQRNSRIIIILYPPD